MTQLVIKIGETEARAELKDASSPRGVAHLRATLPLTTRLTHATRSGNCAVAAHESLQSPDAGIETQVSMYYPGMVAYDAERGYVVLAYGQGQARSGTGVHWVTHLGDLVSGADELAVALQGARDRGATEISFALED